MYTEGVRRTQIYLDEDVDRKLRAVAAAEGRSAADLIREAVRRYLVERGEGGVDPILAMIGTVDGLPSDAATEHDRDLYGPPVGKGRRRR
jgi:plasmid stability protein